MLGTILDASTQLGNNLFIKKTSLGALTWSQLRQKNQEIQETIFPEKSSFLIVVVVVVVVGS